MMTATKEQRDAAEEYINHLEQRLRQIEEAAREVCWFDWSDNDEDAVATIDKLRDALGPKSPIGEPQNWWGVASE